MDSRDVEFTARHKSAVRENAEFRHEMLRTVEELFYHILERPGSNQTSDWATCRPLVRANPYGISALDPRGRWPPHSSEIEQLVLELPKKIAALHAANDTARAIWELAVLDRDLAHSGLGQEEYRLMAAARRLHPDEDLPARLDPLSDLRVFAGPHADRVCGDLMDGYAESFGNAFDRLAPTTHNSQFDARLKRQTVGELTIALSFVLPLGYKVLSFYLELENRFGPEALGLDDDETF